MSLKKTLYVEISGQQSGKTARLVKAVSDYIKQGGSPIVVVANPAKLPKLLQDNPVLNQALVYSSGQFSKTCQLNYYTAHSLESRHRVFYDDFDNYTSSVLVTPNGYYVTSPVIFRDADYLADKKKISSDMLLRVTALAARRKVSVIKFHNPDFGKAFAKEKKAVRSDRIYRQLVLGEYCD